jgi:hypothetical protein
MAPSVGRRAAGGFLRTRCAAVAPSASGTASKPGTSLSRRRQIRSRAVAMHLMGRDVAQRQRRSCWRARVRTTTSAHPHRAGLVEADPPFREVPILLQNSARAWIDATLESDDMVSRITVAHRGAWRNQTCAAATLKTFCNIICHFRTLARLIRSRRRRGRGSRAE